MENLFEYRRDLDALHFTSEQKARMITQLKSSSEKETHAVHHPARRKEQHTLDTQILNKTGRKNVVKKRFPIVLAAVIAVLSITAAAAYVIQWNGKVAERFGANEQQQSELVSAGAAAPVDQTVTANGLTVTALQTLGDNNGIYLLLDVKAPEGVTLSDANLFKSTLINVEGFGSSLNYYYGFIENTDKSGSASGKANERYFELWLINREHQDWNGKKITLDFADLQADKGNLDMYTIVEGKWELSWTLSYSDEMQTFEINKSYDVGGHSVLVKSIELSPLSMTIDLGGADLNQLLEDQKLNDLGLLFVPALIMRDGTTFQSFGGPSDEKWMKTDEYTRTISFNKVLDMDQLTGITLNFESERMDNTLTIALK